MTISLPIRAGAALLPALLSLACHNGNRQTPSAAEIAQLDLARGAVISCGPPNQQLGTVNFTISSAGSQQDFNLALALLHSFEYEESEKVFARIIDKDPGCAMAYWGVAMCCFHPLWTPPGPDDLEKGERAITIAANIPGKSPEETAFIAALSVFYSDFARLDHPTRCKKYEQAMARVWADYPNDREAGVFYALSLDASAPQVDKSFANQKKAGAILKALYPAAPNHPGVIHYIIHTYDYPGLAMEGLSAAREYARVAPSSAHALHMPSHIFTRLGYWDECIASNRQSQASAQCYAQQSGIKGRWAEELHAMDYLMYAYLQKGENNLATEELGDLTSITTVSPADDKVAYAFAAIPARFALENKDWKRAAAAPLLTAGMSWQKYPWQESIFHFTRLLGAAHTGDLAAAHTELDSLKSKWNALLARRDLYKARQVQIQVLGGEAWIDFVSGKKEKAFSEMNEAALLEDSTQKHPVTPGEVLPAKELLADMYAEARLYGKALSAYESSMERSPNRFNSLYGAGHAAEKSGDRVKATQYYRQLLNATDSAACRRPELTEAGAFLKRFR